MFVTSREKTIIELIIKTSGKHTAQSIATYINVSIRTVQRDLKNIEQILKSYELTLEKSPDKGFFISGKNESIFRLMQNVGKMKLIDLSAEERKLLILIELMKESVAVKLAPLANDLGISVTTLVTYLDELSGWLNSFGIELSRKKGVGIELLASEAAMRKALASFFLVNFNEELIENLFRPGIPPEKRVLHYFKPDYLRVAAELLNEKNRGTFQLADSAYVALVVHLCITMQRHEDGFALTETGQDLQIKGYEEYATMKRLSSQLEASLSLSLSEAEILFLSIIWRGSNVQAAGEVYYDSVIIGRSIKSLIQRVSQKLNIDLNDDFSLFQGLLAHMEPSLFRIRQGLASFNPLTGDIKKKYPVLFMAVVKSLEKEFSDIRRFPEDEAAYIVLHFGSALELRKEELSIRALVICPTGIGTSKMLASRMKKEMPEISAIEIASLKEIQEMDPASFDLVVSTVRLPFFQQQYVLVNPLLREADIESIRHFLSEQIESFTKKQHYADPAPSSVNLESSAPRQPLEHLLQEMEDTHRTITMFMSNLSVRSMTNEGSHLLLLKQMTAECEAAGLLQNAESVTEKLAERETQAGLGIPGTSMALFHARHSGVKEFIFRVAHLDQPFTLKGMDREDMQVRNLLFLLAPQGLRARQLEIISLISTVIVENNENMLIFSSSNEKMIRRKLEDTFYDYLQNKLVKE